MTAQSFGEERSMSHHLWLRLEACRSQEFGMTTIASIASIAALIGDPTRAGILVTLMDGRALTAGELAGAAGVTPATASGHLGRLLDAGLLMLEQQGRHRYYRIESASVASLLENMMSLSGELSAVVGRCKPVSTGPRDRALRRARLCYDHLAGEVAVGIATNLISRGQLNLSQDGGAVTGEGLAFIASIGVDLSADDSIRLGHGAFCRPCLDWSERRPHVGGAIGRALYASFMSNNWIRKPDHGRAVSITTLGRSELNRHFGLELS
jgi:DNA-binding transcriptional ArsR family regulator